MNIFFSRFLFCLIFSFLTLNFIFFNTTQSRGFTDIIPITLKDTVQGSWIASDNVSISQKGYAKYYGFTVDTDQEVSINLSSPLTKEILSLYTNSGKKRKVAHDQGNNKNTSINMNLRSGSYILEVSNPNRGFEGNFTLSLSGLSPTLPPPVDPPIITPPPVIPPTDPPVIPPINQLPTPTMTLVGNEGSTTPTVRISGVAKDDKVRVFRDNLCQFRVGSSFASNSTVDITLLPLVSGNHTLYMRVRRNGVDTDCSTGISYKIDTVNTPPVVQPPVIPPVIPPVNPGIRNTQDMIQLGFEESDLISAGLNKSGNAPEFVASPHPVAEGNKSLRIFIDRENSEKEFRTEFTLRGEKFDKKFINFEYGKEYWIGFMLHLDKDYKMPVLSDIVFQTHGIPDFHLGENYRNPILSLAVGNRGSNGKSNWGISILGDDKPVTPLSGPNRYPTNVDAVLGPVEGDLGRWVPWVIHYKHTYNPDGFLNIWKDGIQVYSRSGLRTAFNDLKGSYLKMGSYKWSWRNKHSYETIIPARRLSYLDSLRIAQGPNRYNDVVPSPPVSSGTITAEETLPIGVSPSLNINNPTTSSNTLPINISSSNNITAEETLPIGVPPSSPIRNLKDLIEIGFEKGSLLQDGLYKSGNTPQIVKKGLNPVYEGLHSLKVFIDRLNSENAYRTEFVIGGVPKHPKKFGELEYGKDYWVGFAVYLDENYKTPKLSDLIFQLHGRPDLKLGENYRNPNMTLSISGDLENNKRGVTEPHWAISILGDHRKITPSSGNDRYPTKVADVLTPLKGDVGRWVKWVIHFKHTYNPDGMVEVWKDGKKVYQKTGVRTAFNDEKGSYIKMGSYKWSWRLKHDYPTIIPARRLSFLDAIRVAQGVNRYLDVAP